MSVINILPSEVFTQEEIMDWLKSAMTRKVYKHLDRTTFIITTWNLQENNDFVGYFNRKLNLWGKIDKRSEKQ